MNISIISLTWNSEKYIGKCMDTLFSALENENVSYEIFIVDNGSRDATLSILQSFQDKHPGRIRLISLEKNTGTTYSRNLALKQAIGDDIVIMDSDVEVKPGTIPALRNMLKTQSNTGLVAPRLLYPNGHLQKSVDVFPTVFTKLYRYFFLKCVEKRKNRLPLNPEPCEVDYAISALWVMKRQAFEKVGFLDENIFYSPEDVDYCLRLRKAGYKIIYDPRVTAIHHTQEISRGFRLNKAAFSHAKGLLYYFRKHGYIFKKPVF
jgi:GT2 family glycosyltransferase